MQEKETITSNGIDGNIRLSGDCFCSTSAEPLYCIKSPPLDWKFPFIRLLVKDSYNLVSLHQDQLIGLPSDLAMEDSAPSLLVRTRLIWSHHDWLNQGYVQKIWTL